MKTLYENRDILVRLNPSNEVFYLDKQSGAEIRIEGNLILAWKDCRLTPTSFHGLSAMRMEGGK